MRLLKESLRNLREKRQAKRKSRQAAEEEEGQQSVLSDLVGESGVLPEVVELFARNPEIQALEKKALEERNFWGKYSEETATQIKRLTLAQQLGMEVLGVRRVKKLLKKSSKLNNPRG